jgi:hypothetical protein
MTVYLRIIGYLAVVAGLGLAGPAWAEAVLKDGVLIVHDDAKTFSPEGIKKAKDEFAKLHTRTGRVVTIETMAKLPDAERAKLVKLKDDNAGQRKFWNEYAKAQAKEEKARGVFILISRSPGHVEVLADEEMKRKGFEGRKVDGLEEMFVTALRESAKAEHKDKPAEQLAIRDKALFSAVEYLEKNLPGTEADLKTPTGGKKQASANVEDRRGEQPRQGGMGIGGWVCLIVSVLLGVWLITALVRAFSGGGGGGYGGGGGMGGGGFFPSLLGGLFGAAAGMYMYDHFFGGHSSSATAGDAGAGGYDGGGGAVDDAGAGNWDNGASAGGDYDTGGGDLGGGGDFGGGGGDFGGGDF